jgi:hypothetical protein
MAYWLTVYCTRPVSALTSAELLAGIRDQDRDAPAGVDYYMLAEDYGYDALTDEAVADALARLRAEPSGTLAETAVKYGDDDSRPVVLHCWSDAERVAEELEECAEVREPPASVAGDLDRCVEIVGIELGFSQLGTMGVVFAYEIARYLAQKGAGVFVDDDQQWFRVDDGELIEP